MMPDSVNRAMQKTVRETAFRNSWTAKQGHTPGTTAQGRITNVNMKNWTVDVISVFDRYRWLNIQVGSPYQNTFAGEGFFVVPEVGSCCMVVHPSDSTAPYVSSFVMPSETVSDSSASDAPTGTRSHGNNPQYPSDVTFAGSRPAYTPGTLGMTGRDGQFVLLHRGGVLELGASSVCQRIFIPLANHMIDMSQRYYHHNVGGAVLWGMAEGPGQTNFPTTNIQTFRIMANDQFATVRIQTGDVLNPIPDSSGVITDTVVYEVTVIPEGINADSGDLASAAASKAVTYRYTIDKSGNVSMVMSGDVFQFYKKSFTISAVGTIAFNGEADGVMTFKNGLTVDGGDFATIKGKIVRLGAGSQAVARKGDLVVSKAATIPLKCLITFPATPATSGPCMLQILDSIAGVITTGNDNVKA
jgi:hypothetical protein